MRKLVLGFLGIVLGVPAALLAAEPVPATPTFTKDIAPIFQAKCEACHQPDSIAPMSLVTYEDARPWARGIKQKVTAREMPPWFIDRHVGVRKFKDDPSLTDAEVATIAIRNAGSLASR